MDHGSWIVDRESNLQFPMTAVQQAKTNKDAACCCEAKMLLHAGSVMQSKQPILTHTRDMVPRKCRHGAVARDNASPPEPAAG